ncbi:hypothetical protein CKO50_04535 [Pseudoalteromonas sp. HM-SA03]|uniref:chorismate-binding protein n=1 Tax=Pseudoalteromonas sp. HM-SA03 TaxID=2029678 RepID=UPI000BAE25BD|nr:chorismate-binding protein [Pseudoalteromonas sp. HM-SA03]PAY02503.1 hypothetical protein CKO50_04535 [Pseudoalteromonas sp. HM-SA03]
MRCWRHQKQNNKANWWHQALLPLVMFFVPCTWSQEKAEVTSPYTAGSEVKHTTQAHLGDGSLTITGSNEVKQVLKARHRRCHERTFQVNLSPNDTTMYQVVGALCVNGSFKDKTLQILLSGGTYSGVYLDFPLNPAVYSYVDTANQYGYVTLNLARIGVGQSDRLSASKGAWHAFDELLPSITASGIPKAESIESILHIEAGSRGLYSGAILMLDKHDFEACLVLRSVFQDADKYWI